MTVNTFGRLYKISTFGESHGVAIGGVIDGVPSGIELDFDWIQTQLDRRKPGQSAIVTQRKEPDTVQFLSGIFEGKTTGASIGFIIPNDNQKSHDYDHIKGVFRPSHADFTYETKYGVRDHRGGGRTSARETANWVVGGAVAKHIIPSIAITAYVSGVGELKLEHDYSRLDFSKIEETSVRCPDLEMAEKMIDRIKEIRKEGDTIGGEVTCVIQNVPIGLGEPIFDKLHARLGQAMMSINAVKGFEYGEGFASTSMKGSEMNDQFNQDRTTKTNYSGGIQGGVSNGMDIYFKVAFKPVATLMQEQTTLNADGEMVDMHGKGRHDPCVVPRAVPIVESLAAMVLADMTLIQRTRNY
ncbi:chorismate synthase [Empedobacter brevis]|uniref:chorismate synthase n=1 Tax=Empedobacter brevis TaxID=247 RepID=UPI00334020B5